jgi:hypothetical protein
VSILCLLAFADALDYLLMLIGFAGVAGHGCALPVYIFFFGKLLDGFGACNTRGAEGNTEGTPHA